MGIEAIFKRLKSYLKEKAPIGKLKTAIYYTMISECKRVGIDPLAWLTYVFRELPKHQGEKSLLQILMPEAYAKRQKSEN